MRPYYQDDFVTLYHGDARSLISKISLETVGAVVTDPPYGIGWKRSAHAARGSSAHAGIANDDDTTVRDEVLALTAPIPAVVFGSFYAPRPEDVRQVLVYWKPADAGVVGSTTGYRRDVEPVYLVGPWPQRNVEWPGVLRSCRRSIAAITRETGHPHTKPLDVMRDVIDRCPPGTVLDPFAGSGTTLLAAKDLRRPAIGIELEEGYCRVIAGRLSQDALDFGGAA
jgi:DNA modification methylase